MNMLQSPLFVSTDTDSDSDEFDSDNYDNDNDSIDSEDISPISSTASATSRPLSPDIQISDGTETIAFIVDEKKETCWSTDPFAANYRKKADWDSDLKARWEKEWWFVEDVVEKYESVEHAEFTRPFDQFRVLLQVSPRSFFCLFSGLILSF